MRYFVTGGWGFIGSHFIRMPLEREPNAYVTCVDIGTYAANPENLEDVEQAHAERLRVVRGTSPTELPWSP